MANIVIPPNIEQGGQILPSDLLSLYNFLNNGTFNLIDVTTLNASGLITGNGGIDIASGEPVSGLIASNVTTLIGTASLTSTQAGTVLGNATSGSFTITLPPSSSNSIGLQYLIQKIDPSSNTVTVSGYNTDTINGVRTFVLNSQYHAVLLVNIGSGAWTAIIENNTYYAVDSSVVSGQYSASLPVESLYPGLTIKLLTNTLFNGGFSPAIGGSSGTNDGSPVPVSGATGPQGLAVDSTNHIVFIAESSSHEISVFTYNPSTGSLTVVSGSPFAVVTGALPGGVTLDPTNHLIFVPNYGTANVYVYTYSSSTGVLTLTGGYTTGTGPGGPAIDLVNHFLFVPNSSSNTVSVFSYNTSTGALTAVSGSPFSGLNGDSQNAVVDSTNHFLFVPNYSANNITVYSYSATTGSLTQISGSPFQSGGNPSLCAIDPIKNILFVANQGSNTISMFSYSATTGALTNITGSPFLMHNALAPDTLAIDVTNDLLFVTNNGSSNVSVYSYNGGIIQELFGSPYPAQGGPTGIDLDTTNYIVFSSNYSSNTVSIFTNYLPSLSLSINGGSAIPIKWNNAPITSYIPKNTILEAIYTISPGPQWNLIGK